MPKKPTLNELKAQMEALRERAELAEETLAAIRRGEVDALVVGDAGDQKVYTLQNCDHSYRLLVEEMGDGAVTVNEKGNILFCNKRFAEMAGLPHEKIPGSAFSGFFLEKDHQALSACLGPCVRSGVKAEVVLRGVGDNALPVLLSAHCIQLDGISARACIVTDIKKQQDRLDESNELFRTAIDCYPAAFLLLDNERMIRFINSTAIRIAGLAEDGIVGKRGDSIIPREGVEQYEPWLKKAYQTLKPQSCEASLKFPAGLYHLLIDFIPTLDKEGRLKYMLVFGYDIGGFKRTELTLEHEKKVFEKLVMQRTDELVRAKIELENAQRLSDLGQLAATVAHELRNPLAAISMAAVNIKKKTREPSLEGHLSTIQKKVVESDQIINNLLFYSRLKTPRFAPINIHETVMESINTCRARFCDRILRFDIELKDIERTVIHADCLQLKEVFVNILNNAVDAVPSSVTGDIGVSGRVEGQLVTVIFRDNGIGMDEETRKKVFEPFFTTKSKGTGLGLTVSSQVLKFHSGSLNIVSREGRGTTVSVCLPVK
ncbi:MAG: ATP-binding protein [Deltaproteobacteria bacterium]